MLRRTILLALAGLAIAAPSAFARSHPHWNSQMQYAAATASRSPGGCTLTPGPYSSLHVSCSRGDQAKLVYAFPLGRGGIVGKPWCGVAKFFGGSADVDHSWKVSGGVLRVTVTVSHGSVQLSTVSVGYYTH